MELNNYLKSCSKKLLKLMGELTKDTNLINYYEQFDRNLDSDINVDHTWSLISTALLLSENLWQNDSVYKDIPEESIENIIDELSEGPAVVKGRDITNNCLLDENNKTANGININEIQDVYLLDEMDIMSYRINKKKDYNTLDAEEQSHMDFLDDIFENDVYGANEALITDDRLDYRKFVIRVRHALAHSNYEILDENFIRLYHYNKEKKQLDFNVALNKKIIITILDELNELYYESGKAFIDEWNSYCQKYSYPSKFELDENDVVDQLLKYKLFSKNDGLEIINSAKNIKEYAGSDSLDKIDIIYECFLARIRPACSYGIMVNEFLYGNNEGLIDNEYYTKLGLYKYFTSELFDINMDSNATDYKKHKFELLLFSFLNSVLLNGININNNELFEPIDFSKMMIDEEFVIKASSYTKRLETDINNQITKLTNDFNKLSESITNKQNVREKNTEIKNEYFLEQLPMEIFDKYKKRALIVLELNYLKQALQVSNITNLSNYILTHLRNSLAHGYVRITSEFNMNNLKDLELEFTDYNPDDKSEITFKGSIRLNDLLEILTSKKYINNVLGTKENKLIKR